MAGPKILIIDDELEPSTNMGKLLCEVLSSIGLEVVFCRTWKDKGYGPKGRDILRSEGVFGLVLLDVYFPGQSLEGGEIFEEIKSDFPDLPVVILTVEDSFILFQEFQERGAAYFTVKKQVKKDPQKFLQTLMSILKDPEGKNLTLKLVEVTRNHVISFQLYRQGNPLLPYPKKVHGPLAKLILNCIQSEGFVCEFPETTPVGTIKGLEPMDRIQVQKAVWKFNQSIKKLTDGEVQVLIKGLGRWGMSSFKLLVGKCEGDILNEDDS